MKLRRPFVATFSAAMAACARDGAPAVEVAKVEPVGGATASTSASASASGSASASASGSASASASPITPDPDLRDYPTVVNAVDAQKRTIFRAFHGDGCYVELPWGSDAKPGEAPRPRMPGEAPPTKAVACPAEMKTATWATCRGGTIHAKADRSACVCFRMGNPPPPPERNACP